MGQLDYALVGNCQVSALLDREATYVWMGLPRLDSPSVFSALLGGEEAGFWSCLPCEGTPYEVKQHYLRNTNIVRTEFSLQGGDSYEVIDFAPRYSDGFGSNHRPPQFIRIVRPLKGVPRLKMLLKPKFHYGKYEPEVSLTGQGLVYRSHGETVHLQTTMPLTYLTDGRPFDLTRTEYFVLTHGVPYQKPLKFGLEEEFERTEYYWRRWVKHCRIPYEYQEQVIRSALALKLHIFEDTGAIIAATTTSIPESPEGNRTWDYRYCWLRDAYFVIHALNLLGRITEMERFVEFLQNIASKDPDQHLQPVYGITGERDLVEIELDWLTGFRGYGPVRVGNAAYTHDQFDVYGEMVLAVAPIFFDTRMDRIRLDRGFEKVVNLVEKAIRVFDKPDAGIWEVRSEQKHYLFSKVMCWVAVDRGLRIARQLGRQTDFGHWGDAALRMRRVIETEGWNEELGYYTQELSGRNPDAANLLMDAVGFHPRGHERIRRMVEGYERTLLSEGYMFRYRNADDFGVPRHAFNICTFWFVDALIGLGREREAREIFERILGTANHVGLLSEDVDQTTGELWGNFPQTYSHVGIINSAFRLSRHWGEVF